MEGSQVEGIIIIKAQLGDDIRCIPVHNVDITFDELVLMMQRIFKGQLSPDDEITIKYKDHDGDLVTISDGNDLTFALQLSHMLRITIFQVQQQQSNPLGNNEVKTLRRELQHVRDMVVKMLDKLELRERGTAATVPTQQNGNTIVVADESDSEERSTPGLSNKVLEERPSAHREFDPLHQQQTTRPPSHHEEPAAHVQSVPSAVPQPESAPWGNTGYGAPQPTYQQQQPPQQKPIPQAPPPQQPQTQPQAPAGYYSGMPGSQGQSYQPPPPQHPGSSYYPGGYPPTQQQSMTAPPPPPGGPSAQAPYGQPPGAGYPPPPSMGVPGSYPPGPQPTPPPPPSMGGPGAPPQQFGAPPMMMGQPSRGGMPSYGRYQPGYQ